MVQLIPQSWNVNVLTRNALIHNTCISSSLIPPLFQQISFHLCYIPIPTLSLKCSKHIKFPYTLT